MMNFIQGISLTVLEMICCKMFFEIFGERRTEGKWKNCGIIAGLIITVYSVALLCREYFMIKQLLVIITITLFMIWYFKIHFGKAVILSLLFQGLLLLVDYFALWLNVSLFKSIAEAAELHYVEGSLIWVLSKTFLFLMVLLIREKIGRKSADALQNADLIRFIFFPVFTIFTIIALIVTSGEVENQRQENVFLSIALCLACMNVFVFYLINDLLSRENKIRENKIFKLEAQNQTDKYRSLYENVSKQRKRTHEYKNQLMCIEALVAAKKYDELENYLKNVSGHLNTEVDYIKTNNVIVDAILNSKYKETLEKGIIFIFKINDLSHINVCDEDIVVILSNLLSNAIEACEKCHDKKIIKLKFVEEKDSIIISVKNTFDGKTIMEDGEIQTSKKHDKQEHGIGIKNIIDVISKYQGSYVIRNEGKEFYFSVILPN